MYIEYRVGERQEYADEIYLLDACTISLSEVSREVLRKSQLLGKIFARIQRYNYVFYDRRCRFETIKSKQIKRT